MSDATGKRAFRRMLLDPFDGRRDNCDVARLSSSQRAAAKHNAFRRMNGSWLR